jgi:hypothetical protein
MTDHKPYILNTLSRAIETAAESHAKKSSPKVWKSLQEVAPMWPIYDADRVPYDVLTAWDVAKRVATDDIIKQLLKPAPTDPAKADAKDAPVSKSVADV